MANLFQTLRKVRETAQRNARGEWDFDSIFNREIYPALRALFEASIGGATFPPILLEGETNAITIDHQHVNLLVEHDTACTLTLSESVSRQMPEGTILLIGQEGAGQVELAPDASVTVRSPETLKTRRQYSEVWLLNIGPTEWVLFGDVEEIPINVALLIQDRFIGGALSVTGTNTDANVGQLQWNTVRDSADGTVTRVEAQAGHPGIVRVSANAALGSRQAIYLGHAAVSGSVVALDEVDYFEFLVRNVGTGRFRFGIGNDAAAAGLGTSTMGFSADTDVTATWYGFTNRAGSSSIVSTSVSSAAGPWLKFRIQIVSTSEVLFFIDDALVGSVTDPLTIPDFATLMAPAVQAITITPGPFQGIGEIDLFTMQMKVA